MKNLKDKSLIYVLTLVFLLAGYNVATPKQPVLAAPACEIAPDEPFPTVSALPDESYNRLFTRSDTGWTGGELMPAVYLPDNRTIWLAANAYLGGLNRDRSRQEDSKTVHNALIVQNGNTLTTLHSGTPNKPSDLIRTSDDASWYIPGYSVIEGDKLRVIAGKFHKTGVGMFDVERYGTDIVTFALPSLTMEGVQPVFPNRAMKFTYSSAVLEDADYTYIYGGEHPSGFEYHTYTARVPRGRLLDPWEFYAGKAWSSDSMLVVSTFDGKTESIVKIGNRYLALTTTGKQILAYQSCTPVGPWRNPFLLYMTPEQYPEKADKIFPDTAMAYPQLSKDGKLLIAYHLNFFFAPPEYYTSTADIGRQRFIRLQLTLPTPGTQPAASVIPIAIQPASGACLPAVSPSATVVAVPDEHFNQLFTRSDNNWTGGDGAQSVLLPDGRSVWLFGDTNLGDVNPDRSRSNTLFTIRNSMVVQRGDQLTTVYGGSAAKPTDLLPPPNGMPSNLVWYWPSAGVVEGTGVAAQLRIVAGQYRQVTMGEFGFARIGTDIATFSLPDLKLKDITPIGFANNTGYGTALLEDGDYTYVYGDESVSALGGTFPELHVARAQRGKLLENWEYYTGTGWSPDPMASARIFVGPVNSVTKLGDRYLLLSMTYPFGDQILSYQATSPVGPWCNGTLVYQTPENQHKLFTYIPVVHPEFSSGAEVLISYSVNGQGETNSVNNYRPRFIHVHIPKMP